METLEATATRPHLASETVDRFRRDLDALVDPEAPVGIAVSGGPDSLALLLMAAAARPEWVEAATVDHALRPESRGEAEMVAGICERLGVPHRILTAQWDEKPATAVQERARTMRYRLLGQWAAERGLKALLTGHHLDDQAETLLMRFARGAGIRGLAGMRRIARTPGGKIALLRPLLGWRRFELEAVCAASGVEPADDPSNADDQFERVRVRKALREIEWLDPEAIAASAAHLGQAETALQWATTQEWNGFVTVTEAAIVYRPSDAPREIRRRIIRRAILALATEGQGADLRGRELNQVLTALLGGRSATLRGVLCLGGAEWRFTPAPPRRS